MDKAEEHLQIALDIINSIEENEFLILSENDQESKDSALLSMGKLFLEKGDIDDAINYLNRCVEGKRENWYTLDARINIANIYSDEKSKYFDYSKAIEILSDIQDEEGRTEYSLGKIYSKEDNPEYDMDKAVDYFIIAAEKGNVYAQYQLGKILCDENSKYFCIEKGISWLEKSSSGNLLTANLLLGKIYMNRNIEMFHPEKAVNYLQDVIKNVEKKGENISDYDEEIRTSAYISLGKIYANKELSLYNIDKASFYFIQCLKGPEKNNWQVNDANIQLGRVYSDKQEKFYQPGVAETYFQAALRNMEILQQEYISEKGEVNEAFGGRICYIKNSLAWLYVDKTSSLFNYNNALYILPTREEDSNGQSDLIRGNIYSDSNNVEGYNMKYAVNCYMVAAGKENTAAMVKLAKCYLYGMGVDKDKEEALYWLNKAADAGDQYAKDYINKMDSMKFNNFTYSILRQIFSSMTQTREKSLQRLHEAEFKSNSKQAKKEEYLHHN